MCIHVCMSVHKNFDIIRLAKHCRVDSFHTHTLGSSNFIRTYLHLTVTQAE